MERCLGASAGLTSSREERLAAGDRQRVARKAATSSSRLVQLIRRRPDSRSSIIASNRSVSGIARTSAAPVTPPMAPAPYTVIAMDRPSEQAAKLPNHAAPPQGCQRPTTSLLQKSGAPRGPRNAAGQRSVTAPPGRSKRPAARRALRGLETAAGFRGAPRLRRGVSERGGLGGPFAAPRTAAGFRGAPRLRRSVSERGGLGGPFAASRPRPDFEGRPGSAGASPSVGGLGGLRGPPSIRSGRVEGARRRFP